MIKDDVSSAANDVYGAVDALNAAIEKASEQGLKIDLHTSEKVKINLLFRIPSVSVDIYTPIFKNKK